MGEASDGTGVAVPYTVMIVKRDLEVVVLEKRRLLLGDEDPLTLHSMGALGVTLTALGRFKKAEGLKVMLIERQKEVFGESHPDTLHTMENLANTYR